MRWGGVRWGGASVATVGSVLAAASLLLALTWSYILDAIIAQELKLSPGSQSYAEWVQPSVPLYFDVFLFNWTNAEAFPHEKPHLQEVGPFRFREYREKVNITWHEDRGTVSYKTLRSWHWVEEGSGASLKDNITTLNVIVASAVYRARHWPFLRTKLLSFGLSTFGERVWVRRPAAALLFDGYADPLLDMARSFPSLANDNIPLVDKFGFFYQRNNSMETEGHMEVSVGAGGALPGHVVAWNHQPALPYYSGPCAQLWGSVGEFMVRGVGPSVESVGMFTPELCRVLTLHRLQERALHGLTVTRYSATARTFDNGSIWEENICYCPDCQESKSKEELQKDVCHNEDATCQHSNLENSSNPEADVYAWSGTFNLSSCRYGSPAFVSLPHFLWGSEELREGVTGMAPDPEKHSFYMDIEPVTGVPLQVAARFQLNFYVAPNPDVVLYSRVRPVLMPVLWVQQVVAVPGAQVAQLSVAVAAARWGTLAFTLLALAWTLLALAPFLPWCRSRRRPPTTRLTADKQLLDSPALLYPMLPDKSTIAVSMHEIH